jgi:hypothetical protein
MSSLQKVREQEERTSSAWKARLGVGEVAQIMYTHVSKCKKDKKIPTPSIPL